MKNQIDTTSKKEGKSKTQKKVTRLNDQIKKKARVINIETIKEVRILDDAKWW